MKKVLLVFLALCVLGALVCGCVQNQSLQNQNNTSNTTSLKYSALISSESVNVSNLACNISVVKNIDEFTFRMMSSFSDQKNQFFSPVSMEFAFATLGEGAGGKTRFEIFKALYLPYNDTVRRVGFACLYDKLEKSGNFTLANALWIQVGYPVKGQYLHIVKNYYPAEMYYVNFQQSGVVKLINGWVSKKTHGRIENIVSKVDPSTKLAITNAVYFKGDWVKKFSKAGLMDFHTPSGVKKVKSMEALSHYQYSEYDGFKAVEIPYRGDFSMLVVMANSSKKLNELNYSTFEGIISHEKAEYVKVYMPKFELSTQYDLRGVMEKLGMKLAFTPQANFSGISDEKLCVGQAVHKAYVKVDENGTVAAAATYIGVVSTALPPQHYVVFKVDKPFCFFILENVGGKKLVLFAGRVLNPS